MKVFIVTRALGFSVGLLLTAGCGSRENDAYEQLMQRQQRRETAVASQAMTLEQRLGRARMLLEEDDPVAAEKLLRPLLLSHQNHSQVVLLAARTQAQLDQYQDAISILEQSLDPSDEEAFAESLLLAASWLMEIGRPDEAIQKLQQRLVLVGEDLSTHRMLARLFNFQGRPYEAATHLRTIAKLGSIERDELLQLIAVGDPSIVAISREHKNKEQNSVNLRTVRQRREAGDLQHAARMIEELASRDPSCPHIASLQGLIYAEALDHRSFQQWLTSTPPSVEEQVEFWHALGIFFRGVGKHGIAVRCLGEAIFREPTNVTAYDALARSLALIGHTNEAEQARRRAEQLGETILLARQIRLQPRDQTVYDRLADLLQQLERPFEAIAWKKRYHQLHDSNAGKLTPLERRRSALATSWDSPPKPFRVCNLDLSQFPLPSFESKQLDQLVASIPAIPDSESRFQMIDVAASSGLHFHYDNGDDPEQPGTLIHQLTGGGIGVIDIDLDGYSDLYFTQGGSDVLGTKGNSPNCLFQNRNGQSWEDISTASGTDDRGYGQGVAVADINQDGFPDLVVANVGPNFLLINNGDGTFRRSELPSISTEGEWTTSTACGDLNGDHLPDIFEVNYIDDPAAMVTRCERGSSGCSPKHYRAATDRIWQIDLQGRYGAYHDQSSLTQRAAYGFGVLIANIDGKAGNDVFVANDTVDNHFWVSRRVNNEQIYHLREAARSHGCARGTDGQPRGCMGVAHGDFDRDQLLDLYITNFANEPADLFLQAAGGIFVAAPEARGAYQHSRQMVGWGTQAVDLDRNGWLDLIVLNGHVTDRSHLGEPFKMHPQLFAGQPTGLQLVSTRLLTDRFWSTATLGRTLAFLDWNRDGNPDLVTNHLDAPTSLLENHSSQTPSRNHYVQFQLVGRQCERDAIGAVMTIVCGDQSWTHCNAGGDGFLCSNESLLDFGIGESSVIDQVRITWPNGGEQVFEKLPADRSYLVVENNAQAFELK